MKKVAIMTWYTYRNFGTALQAAAISKIITSFGYSPYFIKYKPKGDYRRCPMTPVRFCKKAAAKILSVIFVPFYYSSAEQEALFSDFLSKRIQETGPCETEKEFARLCSQYDAFLCGSDQIWSPTFFDKRYYLDFVKDKSRMVAYAPSIGTMQVDDPAIRSQMATLLRRFSHLSVREEQGANIIKALTGQSAEVVLDPTLLLAPEEWDEYAETEKTSRISGKYILCYYLGDPRRYRKTVNCITHDWHLPIYEIPITRVWGKYPTFPFEVGPKEFVSLIRNAAFVFTDSFHGVAFSINFGVSFIAFERFAMDDPKSQNSRIYNILSLTGLEDHLMSPDKPTKPGNAYNVDVLHAFKNADIARKRLNELRLHSLRFLSASLKAAIAANGGETETDNETF